MPGTATQKQNTEEEQPELCGHPTASGEPCQLTASFCPHHGPDAPGNPGSGRPSSYRPKYCQRVVELGKEGASKVEMAADIGVLRRTLDRWRDRYPEFRLAMARAEEASLAHWMQWGRGGVKAGKDFNERQYKFMATNMFPKDLSDSKDINIRGTIASLDFDRLPGPLLQRIAAGEDPTVVLAEAAERAQELLLEAGDDGDGGDEVQEADYEVVDDGEGGG